MVKSITRPPHFFFAFFYFPSHFPNEKQQQKQWSLAREVSKMGELGVVSGTAIDTILVRELQDGDKDGSIRRALASFPDQDMVSRIMDKYFIEEGRADPDHDAYKSIPMWTVRPQQHLLEVCILANYCEVWLAKHNDDSSPTNGLVGINLLTKVQLPTAPSLYGAILAGVDYVIMGAGKNLNFIFSAFVLDCVLCEPEA